MGRRSYAGGGIFNIEEDEISHVDVMCYGASTGSLAVIVHGGVPPYQFSIDGENWQSEEYFDNLSVPDDAVKSTDEYGGIWIGEYTLYCKDARNRVRSVKANMQSPVARELIINPNNTQNYNNGNLFFVPDTGKDYATPLPDIEYYCPIPSTLAGDTQFLHTVYAETYNIGSTTMRTTISSRGCREIDVSEIPIHVAPHLLPNAIKDYDGNWYDAAIIGDKVWLASNLKTTHYADGTPITNGDNDQNDQQERYYTADGELYYNRPAIINGWSAGGGTQIQGVSPTGWHIPTLNEALSLRSIIHDYYDYENLGNVKQIASKTGWNTSTVDKSPGKNPELNNTALLNLYPLGYMWKASQGNYILVSKGLSFNVAIINENPADNYNMYGYSDSNSFQFGYPTSSDGPIQKGLSVRCICDSDPLTFIKWYWNQYGSFDHQLS